jgi:hypothetical protein
VALMLDSAIPTVDSVFAGVEPELPNNLVRVLEAGLPKCCSEDSKQGSLFLRSSNR